MCTGGPRNSRNPQRAQPAQTRRGPSFGPHASVTPEPIASHQRVLACTGPAGDPRTRAAKRGQAADMSELPLRILMQSPAPAFVISHAARHMTERWYPSSGWGPAEYELRSARSDAHPLRAYLPFRRGWRLVSQGRAFCTNHCVEREPHARQVPWRLSGSSLNPSHTAPAGGPAGARRGHAPGLARTARQAMNRPCGPGATTSG